VQERVVVLTGRVKSYAERIAAQNAAHHVQGVLDVANEIEVEPVGSWQRSDADIAAAVRSALEWHALVPDKDIQSTVTNGWVTLGGTVQRWTQREDAARAIRDLAGIVGVTNNIAVVGAPAPPDRIRQDIEDAIRRQTERELSRLNIEVKDGVATLSGKVRSWAEKRAARAAAGAAPGIRAVADELIIEPSA
jgi:osmotically-inducible protein OsmY